MALVSLTLALGVSLQQAPKAQASLVGSCAGAGGPYFGRDKWCGYFLNRFEDSGGRVYPSGVPASVVDANSFISFISASRSSPTIELNYGSRFTILTMMGINQPGIGYATADAFEAEWEARVRAMDSYGGVQMHFAHPFPCGIENTYWQPTRTDDAFFTEDPSSGDGCGPGVTRDSIIFCNINCNTPGRVIIFSIKRDCGNPIGEFGVLPQADYDVTMAIDDNGSSLPGPGHRVIAGKQYRIGVLAHNNGPAASEVPAVMEVMYPGAAKVVQPCNPVPVCPDPGQSGLLFSPPGPGGTGFETTSWIPGVAGTNWVWSPGVLQPGWNAGGVINWTVAPTAPVGSTITFTSYYYKVNRSGAVSPPASITFTVVSERTPGISGLNSDVHAGGGICGQATSSGYVQGFAGGSSMGEYVVAASQASNGINGFKSNGTGADSLRLGQNGGYTPVCRPDLLKAANAYRASGGAGIGTIGGGPVSTVNLSCLTTAGANCGVTTGGADVYYFDGSQLNISGQINRRVTIVTPSGKVRVTGPVTITGASFSPHDAPSLGVIAGGDIEIPAGVTRVDAYLFSNGLIDTCVEASPACATPALVVNGFLMGHDMALHRLGPNNTNGTPIAEQITLNPQIYLNPPKMFDASVDDILLQGQGERQPLF